MHKLNELYYRINSLYIFYKSSHLLSKSINFYQNHKFFFELYEKLDDELDTLAELTLAVDDNDKSFNAITIFEESAKYATKTSNSFKENVELAIMQEVEILDLIEELQKEKRVKTPGNEHGNNLKNTCRKIVEKIQFMAGNKLEAKFCRTL